jgi:hypothetical protein
MKLENFTIEKVKEGLIKKEFSALELTKGLFGKNRKGE